MHFDDKTSKAVDGAISLSPRSSESDSESEGDEIQGLGEQKGTIRQRASRVSSLEEYQLLREERESKPKV